MKTVKSVMQMKITEYEITSSHIYTYICLFAALNNKKIVIGKNNTFETAVSLVQ